VYASIAGTRTESAAVGVLRAWALNGAMDTCMAEQGFPEWNWSRARDRGVDPGKGLSASALFSEPLRIDFALAAIATKDAARLEAGLMEDEPTGAAADAVDACLSDPDVRRGSAGPVPSTEAISQMQERWWGFVGGLDEYGDVVGYYRCLQAADLDVLRESGQPIDELDAALSTSYPSRARDVPQRLDAPDASPAWRHAVELEQQVARASWDCRADTYEAHTDDVLADVRAFEYQWAAQIDALDGDWREVVAAAEALGWDPATNTVPSAVT
jgi:hypothetical protein